MRERRECIKVGGMVQGAGSTTQLVLGLADSSR